MILDNLVVVFSMFLWALGLPILDLQQEGWDGFSLSSARALLAGLTMLGLAYFSRPVFFSKERGVDLFCPRDIRIRSGESTFGDRDWLCRSGYSSDHCRIGTGHISIVRRYCDTEDDRFPSFYCCDPLSGRGIDCNIK